MIDIHCHILDGLDDGSDNIEESIAMAKIARESGTNIIVATPHTNIPGSYRNYYSEKITQKVKNLQNALDERDIKVRIMLGQEIFCAGRVNELFSEKKLITLNGSIYPLVEFDFYEHSSSVYRKAEMLIAQGYVPIIAHPERYRFVGEDEEAVYKLKNIGCLLQINKGSVYGSFGERAMEISQRILEERLADFIASDAHSPYMRTPNMADVHEMICENISVTYADFLFEHNPKIALQNKKIYPY